ncbi:MAG: hypothetical protein D6689_15275 [Deltaproteobacteria bacterium]|nr:MAG: hypothetical protein D6689_15275 [Deltaproteobacteria bacterium]
MRGLSLVRGLSVAACAAIGVALAGSPAASPPAAATRSPAASPPAAATGSPAASPTAPPAAAAAARAARERAIPRPRATAGGFRLEGEPAIEVLFGDAAGYRRHIDAFYQLAGELRDARAEFERYAAAAQRTLAAHRRGCPVDAVAPLYAGARDRADRYRAVGARLEAHVAAIERLDRLGETAALPPDYRWRARRAPHAYREALRDYREMRAVLDRELAADLAFHRCDADALVAAARASGVPPPDALYVAHTTDDAPPSTNAGRRGATASLAAVATDTATFFVDNGACPRAIAVYVDGALLGEVAAGERAAFQAAAGRHEMCLLPAGSAAACGAPGTVRTAHVHDGWAVTMRCAPRAAR